MVNKKTRDVVHRSPPPKKTIVSLFYQPKTVTIFAIISFILLVFLFRCIYLDCSVHSARCFFDTILLEIVDVSELIVLDAGIIVDVERWIYLDVPIVGVQSSWLQNGLTRYDFQPTIPQRNNGCCAKLTADDIVYYRLVEYIHCFGCTDWWRI